jgi:peptidoglycan/LPS O-acetylase OafA/YrhL
MTLSERNVRIDVLRGVAVLGVLLIHTQNAWYLAAGNVFVEQGIRLRLRDTWLGMLSAPATLGFLGLNLFFLLSGFCIHLWTLKRQNNAPFW